MENSRPSWQSGVTLWLITCWVGELSSKNCTWHGVNEWRLMFEGRAAISYDHGYDAEVLRLGLTLDRSTSKGSSKVIGENRRG